MLLALGKSREKGAFLVDDAAQALGATLHGCPAGTLGDVGFYSFGRGKALAAMEGGIIVTSSEEIASAIQAEGERLPSASAAHVAWLLFEMAAYSVFLNPRLYWIPNSLPFLKLGSTEYAPDYPIFRLPALVQGLLPMLFERLQEINKVRRDNAAALAQAVANNPLFMTPRPGPGCQPNYVRFPLVARDRATRDRAVRLLCAAGIGASPFYPSAICDIPGIESHMATHDYHCPEAESVSRRLLTLPTHPFVGAQDLQRIIEILRGL